MNIVISGAGQVGFNLAKYLGDRGHDITIIDTDQKLIDQINETMDVKAICGHGAHPDVLRIAGLESADILIAVTQSDEVNMVCCEVAKTLFEVPQTIARVRSHSYWEVLKQSGEKNRTLNIDFAISPEEEVASALTRSLGMPGAFDFVPLADNRLSMIGLRCNPDSPLVNTPITHISNLFPDVELMIVGISRAGYQFVPDPFEIILAQDEIYFVVDSKEIEKAFQAFGYTTTPTKRLILLGGGVIGLHFAQAVEREYPDVRIHIIEKDPARASYISQQLKHTVVLNGDAMENHMMEEAGIKTADTVVAITDDERVNTLATVLAKRLGSKRTICLANNPSFSVLAASMGADAIINPRVVTVSKIMQYIRLGKMHSIHSLGEDLGELIDVDASVASSLIGRSASEIFSNFKILVAAIIREKQVLIPRLTTLIATEDRLILMLPARQSQEFDFLLGIE